ncbi:HEPN domain-containing protein [Synechococcus sp. BDU 130192]|uniref:HEPN domain-containing protein n=1 Tax=Synechococcus sp. BDU 130192 TaxID=2042059 RepID=UPI000C08CDCA|nr:HEPN domain-containing protein [Synechococcus sp. BDU 130192]
MKKYIKIVTPFQAPFNSSDELITKESEKSIAINFEDVCGKFTIGFSDDIDNKLVQELINTDDSSYSPLWRNSDVRKYKYLILKFELESFSKKESYDKPVENLCCEGTILSENAFSWREVDLSSTSEYVYRLFMLSINCIYLNRYGFGRGYILIEEKFFSRTEPIQYVSIEDHEGNLKFTLEKITLEEIWDYLLESDLFYLSRSHNNINRAIIAISKIQYESKNSFTNLMFSMMAIESLYARGQGNSISSQLLDKIKLFLGNEFLEKASFSKKRINRIYQIRSKYIHGNSDLSFPFVETEYYFDTESEILEAFEDSYFILVSTLIKIIKQSLFNFDFCYSLNKY